MSYQEFDPVLLHGDPRYVSPGTVDGEEGDCPSVVSRGGYCCTLDRGHTGRHVAHGLELIEGQRVDVMYAEWDDTATEDADGSKES